MIHWRPLSNCLFRFLSFSFCFVLLFCFLVFFTKCTTILHCLLCVLPDGFFRREGGCLDSGWFSSLFLIPSAPISWKRSFFFYFVVVAVLNFGFLSLSLSPWCIV